MQTPITDAPSSLHLPAASLRSRTGKLEDGSPELEAESGKLEAVVIRLCISDPPEPTIIAHLFAAASSARAALRMLLRP
jgi:hypothetical protein